MKTRNLLLAILASSALWGCANPVHQIVVDAKVDELCAKDGKAVVYEKEAIPRSEAKIAQSKKYLKPSDTHYWEGATTRLEGTRLGGVPDINRRHVKLFRVRDSRLLGEHSSYFRWGGDFLPGHPSAHSCKYSPEEALIDALFVSPGAKE